MKQETIEQIIKNKIIVIMRTVNTELLLPTVKALYDGGIRLVEVTFDQSGTFHPSHTAKQIGALNETFGDHMLIGAGTVLTEEQVLYAYEAGAKYIISPNTDRHVIEKTVSLDMVSIPGAMTPSEIQNAHLYGADLIKVFPAGVVGEAFFKDTLAPLSHVKLIATGGIDVNNFKAFLKAGAVGAGIGSGLVKKELMNAGKFEEITLLAKQFCEQI
jgi:Entner-Doudoroff aldolase